MHIRKRIRNALILEKITVPRFPIRFCKMFIVKSNAYPELMEHLKIFFPKSLPVYYLLYGSVKREFVWNDMEFVVDQWPAARVVICRPTYNMTADGKKVYMARPISYAVTLWSSNPVVLAEMLADSDLLVWEREISFNGLSCPDDVTVVADICRNRGTVYGQYDKDWCCDVYELRPETLRECPMDLPLGFYLSSLSPIHAAQVNKEWAFGGNEGTKEYLENTLDMLKQDGNAYPSAAILDAKGRAVSYIVYEPEGNMALGYTDPNHRKKGFFQIVSCMLAKTLFDLGRSSTYVQIAQYNEASRNVFRKLGATLVPDWKQHWLFYRPKDLEQYNYSRFNFERRRHSV